MENSQINILNKFNSQQILNVLIPLEKHLKTSVELIDKSNSPTLTSSIVSLLNNLSVDAVHAINDLIIKPQLGKVDENSIILYKYYSFNSSYSGKSEPIYDNTPPKNNVKKVEYQLLYLDNFILISKNPSQNCSPYSLEPNEYNIHDNSINVIKNLTTIINIINRVIDNYKL
jgi:hypothetical protein